MRCFRGYARPSKRTWKAPSRSSRTLANSEHPSQPSTTTTGTCKRLTTFKPSKFIPAPLPTEDCSRESKALSQCLEAHHVDVPGRHDHGEAAAAPPDLIVDSLRLHRVSPDQRSPSYDFQKDDPPHRSWEPKPYDWSTRSQDRSQSQYRQGWSYSGISHEITKEANLPTKAGGNHPNNSQLPPATKEPTSLKTLPRHNRPPQLVPQLHQCPSNQNLSRPFPMTNPITTQNRPTVTGRSLHKLQSLPTLSGKAKPSRSANQSLRRKGRSV